MKIREAIQLLQAHDDEETVCLVYWTIDDVRAHAPGVSVEQAAEVLEAMEANHDSQEGISVHTIDHYLVE